jgi:hypothetical protein
LTNAKTVKFPGTSRIIEWLALIVKLFAGRIVLYFFWRYVMDVNFENEKPRLLEALEANIKGTELEGKALSLIEGFLMPNVLMTITGETVLGGPNMPMVALMENKSGKLHFFALKALRPDLDIWKQNDPK